MSISKTKQIPQIVPLTAKTLKSALDLVNSCFPVQMESEKADFWIPASLGMHDTRKKNRTAISGRYWTACARGKVVGVIGLWEKKKTMKQEYWIGWFCVDPAARKKGIGTALLDFAIAQARKDKKKYLKLYTSEDPAEAAAQHLYEKKGLKITTKKKFKDFSYTTIYRMRRL
ncbi:MAG: GNAT family N-acetyltransferase [Candidatus Aenigmarchaeota archaeon]|nr:GNAT family N-acetyltransferase [Candidatus Aenigmarchaeota archaeon]